MSNETEQKPTTPRTRIEVSVEFDEIPGQPQQPPAVVCCKELPVRSYEAAVKVIDSEPKLIDLALTKPPGWSVTLTPASYAEVAAAVKEVNHRFFDSLARQVETARRIGVARAQA